MIGRRQSRGAVVVLSAVAVVGPASGWMTQAIGAEPSSQPATTGPAEVVPLDPAVEKILDRLERKGKTIEDIEAVVHYSKIDTVLGSKQKYEGILRFMKDEPNPRFLIRFDKRNHDGIISEQKEWHVFDGQWYIEAREKTQTINKREVLRPGERRELFRLGQGPFPLPFGQNKADIVRNLTVKLAAPAKDDPADTDHLECTPRPGTKLAEKYGTVHFYIERKTDLPIQLRTVEKEEENEIVVSFPQIKLNPKLPTGAMSLPTLKDYTVTEERLPPVEPEPTEEKKAGE